MNALKTLLRSFLLMLVLLGLLLAGPTGCSSPPLPEPEIATPAPTPEVFPYSDEDLQHWVDEAWQSGAEQVVRNYAAEGTSAEELFSKLDEYSAYLYANNPRYWYCVSANNYETATYTNTTDADYIALTLKIRYAHSLEDYEALPRCESVSDALRSQSEALASGEGKYVFLAKNGWSEEELSAAARELILNSAEIAAESVNYSYYFITGELDDYEYVEITPNYNVDEELLQQANAQLRAALDAMAEELRAKEIGDTRELYLAAARAILDKASYDDDTLMATYTEKLSDEQKTLRSAYGAVVAGKTVCTGYAMAFKALCDRLELPCWVVDGYNETDTHAWNMIELDGEIRYADCTFADSTADESYLIMDEEKLKERHYYYAEEQPCPWAP